MSNFVTTTWLKKHINDDNIVIVDCRADLFDKDYGKKCYEKSHIINSVFLDLKKDLVGEVKEHGGRSPLPDLQKAKNVLEDLGIGSNSIVIAYDEAELAGAERFWWFLKYLGHKNVYVLDGGINKWIKEGNAVTLAIPQMRKGSFNICIQDNMITDMRTVRSNIKNTNTAIIDSRLSERYRGEVEPIDKKAGHIPNAKNYYWRNNLKDNGEFKDIDELKDNLKWLNEYEQLILYCGSGIDACGNYIVMDELGFKPRLYIGSWSDWITYEENQISAVIKG